MRYQAHGIGLPKHSVLLHDDASCLRLVLTAVLRFTTVCLKIDAGDADTKRRRR